MKGEVFMVGMFLGLEVLMNHIGINDEYILGYSVGSFDGITYGKIYGFICRKYFEEKYRCGDGGIRIWSMNLKSRQRSGFIKRKILVAFT